MSEKSQFDPTRSFISYPKVTRWSSLFQAHEEKPNSESRTLSRKGTGLLFHPWEMQNHKTGYFSSAVRGDDIPLLYTATLITAEIVIPAPVFTGVTSSGNPGKYWIPGQARNDKTDRTYVVMYNTKNS
jgi:hypothetical protein